MAVSQRSKKSGFIFTDILAGCFILGLAAAMLLVGGSSWMKYYHQQLYKLENGTLPEGLTELDGSYLAKGSDFKDALNEDLTYTVESDGLTYTLKGKNAAGNEVVSGGSKSAQ